MQMEAWSAKGASCRAGALGCPTESCAADTAEYLSMEWHAGKTCSYGCAPACAAQAASWTGPRHGCACPIGGAPPPQVHKEFRTGDQRWPGCSRHGRVGPLLRCCRESSLQAGAGQVSASSEDLQVLLASSCAEHVPCSQAECLHACRLPSAVAHLTKSAPSPWDKSCAPSAILTSHDAPTSSKEPSSFSNRFTCVKCIK